MLLPFIPVLAGVLDTAMEKGFAYTVATTVITSIPGIFGFLAWELRENWQIYAANRPKQLWPVAVWQTQRDGTPTAPAGPPLRNHSQTICQTTDRGQRRRAISGDWTGVHKHLRAFEELEHSVSRFVEREFVWFLSEGGFAERLRRSKPGGCN